MCKLWLRDKEGSQYGERGGKKGVGVQNTNEGKKVMKEKNREVHLIHSQPPQIVGFSVFN